MQIRALELTKGFGVRTLFENLSFSFHHGEHIGLIGPNGSGKSTLLKILCDQEELDSGIVEGAQGLRLAYLPQEEFLDPEKTLEETLLESLKGSTLETHERTTRVRVLLGKIGFSDFSQKAGILSGGWQKRLAIARQLVQEPNLLLLDEPTNHLDLSGILWLEQFLTQSNVGFIMVSHDRYMLESVTDRIIEINARYPDGYYSTDGCYSDFLEKREEWFAQQEKHEQMLAGQVRQEIAWLRRRPSARRTKSKGRIQSAHQKMETLTDLQNRNRLDGTVGLDFASTQRKTNDLLVAKDITKAFGDNRLFRDLEFTLSPGTRLGIVGDNGTGKTTLIRVLLEDLPRDAGTIKHARELKVAWFDQKREQLNRTEPLRQALAPNGDMIQIGSRKMHVTGWARRFLFRIDQLDTPVGDLSGGEQARVRMAQLMRQPADILIFDEPTNDLDIDSIEVLEASLCQFPGAVVLITHDRCMLDRICNQIVGLHAGGDSRLYGELAQWQTTEARRRKEASSPKPAKKTDPPPRAKGLARDQRKELRNIENAIPKAEAAVEALQAEADNKATSADHKTLTELYESVAKAQAKVDSLYDRWERLLSEE